MTQPTRSGISPALNSQYGWWFASVFEVFGGLLTDFGYQLEEARSSFRGNHVSYLGPRYRVVLEFDPDTRTLTGEFWDLPALEADNHLWVLRFWDLLRSRDPTGDWTAPTHDSPLAVDSATSTLRHWADGLRQLAPDVISGGPVEDRLWTGIW